MQKIQKIQLTVPSIWFKHSSIWPRWLRWIEFKIRTKVFKQPRYLIDHWDILKAELECRHGLDLEEEIAKMLKGEIEK